MSILAFRSGIVLVAVSLCASALNACGSDSKDTPAAGGSTSGGAKGSGGAAGGGGAGGVRSSGGSSGAGGATTATGNKTCGGGVCDGAPVAMGIVVNACCPGGDTQPACGLDLGLLSAVKVTVTPPCQAKHQPGAASAECPDTSIVASGAGKFTFKGCCRPDHRCGGLVNTLDVTALMVTVTVDLGCVATEALADAGPEVSCTPAGGTDAGATDASTD